MKLFKNTLTILALFTISSLYTSHQSPTPKSRKAVSARAARTRTARKASAKKSPVVQRSSVIPITYDQILASLRTITPTNADNATLLSIRTEIDRQIAIMPQDIVQKIRTISDTILDDMENAGGHALARHVDQSHSDMALRLARENIGATSTFINKKTAIKAVKENLKHNAEKIASWIKSNPSLNERKPFFYTHSYTIGKSVIRGKENAMLPSVKSIVVLAPDPTNDLEFRIVTAYPTHK